MRTSILDIQKQKAAGVKIPMVTAYDATAARLVEAAGLNFILVGDSLGMVVQGHETTLPVTLDEMIYHARMVVRGTQKALIVLDMPFMSYKITPEQALTNSARALQEAGVSAVKMEGGTELAPTIERVTRAGIPVMGHIGLTPQAVHQLGGWRVQGKDRESARQLIADAVAIAEAGVFAMVLEGIPAQVAKQITTRVSVPTIGIGAGADTDGQVQVFHDLLGLLDGKHPRHAKSYRDLGSEIRAAIGEYADEVRNVTFPTESHAVQIDQSVLEDLY